MALNLLLSVKDSISGLEHKTPLTIVIILIFGSSVFGVDYLDNSANSETIQLLADTSNEKLLNHISHESPHLGTETKLDFIMQDVQDSKTDIKQILEKIQTLTIIVCTNSDYQC